MGCVGHFSVGFRGVEALAVLLCMRGGWVWGSGLVVLLLECWGCGGEIVVNGFRVGWDLGGPGVWGCFWRMNADERG